MFLDQPLKTGPAIKIAVENLTKNIQGVPLFIKHLKEIVKYLPQSKKQSKKKILVKTMPER